MPVINVVVDLSQEEAQGQRHKVRRPGAAGQLFGPPLLPNSPRCITVETDISPPCVNSSGGYSWAFAGAR